MKNKRGFIFIEIPMWMIRFFFMILVMFALLFIFNYFIVTDINVQKAEANTLAGFFFYSKEGLAYCDNEIERCYPGMIDYSVKFAPEVSHLNRLIPGDPTGSAAKISYSAEPVCMLVDGVCLADTDCMLTDGKCQGDDEDHCELREGMCTKETRAYYKFDNYENLNILVESGLTTGLGGADRADIYKMMRIKNGDETLSRQVKFEVFTQNS
ncbi:hypothetical protein JXB11_01150 [Candidatus Woesearchaeota archaeon]|nr:hypothetical protein [Candidatus Woesearchaeota archaeon]